MQKKLTRVAIAVLAVSALVAVTAPSNAAVKGIKGGLKIAIMPKAVNIGYFTAWDKGATTACAEIGARCKYLGPTQATGAAQVQFINQVIQQKYNVLVISAADQNAIVPALNKAKAAGITIVTSDADVDPSAASSRVTAVLPASSTRIGTAEVDWIAQATGSKGSIAILSAAATAANQNAWIAAMGPYLTSKYPNMSWVGGTVAILSSTEMMMQQLQHNSSMQFLLNIQMSLESLHQQQLVFLQQLKKRKQRVQLLL